MADRTPSRGFVLVVAVFAAVAFATPTITPSPFPFEARLDVGLKTGGQPASVASSGDTLVVGTSLAGNFSGAARVFTRVGQSWSEEAQLTPDDAAASDRFGGAVAVSGDTVIVGATSKDSEAGAAYVFTRDGGRWLQQARLPSPDSAPDLEFGYSVAIDGNTAIVGAFGRTRFQGGAYVFTRTGTTWSGPVTLVADDPADLDYFGWSVAFSGDTAVLGAYGKDGEKGAAYVFARTGAVWTQQAKLVADDGVAGDQFGASVALSGDTIVVGASYTASTARGGAYVFVRNGSTWTQQAKLAEPVPAKLDQYGYSVAIEGDTALVGAPGLGAGTVMLWRRNGTAWSFVSQFGPTNAESPGPLSPVPASGFGYGMAMSGGHVAICARISADAATRAYVLSGVAFSGVSDASARGLCVGTPVRVAGVGFGAAPKAWLDRAGKKIPLKTSPGATDTQFDAVLAAAPKGSAGACTLNVLPQGASAPFLAGDFSIDPPAVARVSPPSAPAGARVTISGRRFGTKAGKVRIGGKTCKVAAWRDAAVDVMVPKGLPSATAVDVTVDARVGSATATAAFVGAAASPFPLQDELTAPGYFFGYDVATDGDTLLVGAPDEVTQRSAVYVYGRVGAAWALQARLVPPDAAAGDRFGFSVALSGDTAVVGAYAREKGAGGAYVFRRARGAWNLEWILAPMDDLTGAHLGTSVAVSGDTALVGAPFFGSGAGSAYVFRRAGSSWAQEQALAGGGSPGLYFGSAVALRGDRAVVGELGGATAYVFDRSGTSWTPSPPLVGAAAGDGSLFGSSVDVEGDTVLVGALAADGPGAAWVFTRESGVWTQQAKLVSDDAVNNDYFGTAVALQGDTALIGGYVKDALRGSAYSFQRSGSAWTQTARFVAPGGQDGDHFGLSVAAGGGTAFVGAPFRAGATGAVYAFAGVPYAGVATARPATISVGATIVVTGAGFGPRPKAWLDLAGTKLPLKVEAGASDSQFRATLASAPPGAFGACTLDVLPKGTKTPFAFGGLTILGPSISAVGPGYRPAGSHVTIAGAAFGPATGSVSFGGQACVVVAWHDTWIEVVVPAGLSAAPVDVVVTTASATVTAAGGFSASVP